jgi:hypothetical protein
LITHINDGESRKQVKVSLDNGSTGTLGLFVGNDDFAVPERNYTAGTIEISGDAEMRRCGDAENHVGLLKELDFGGHKFNHFLTYFKVEGSSLKMAVTVY